MTHQLRVISGAGKIADDFIQKFLYKKINRFTQCWIPDIEGDENIAGVLSHPLKKPNKFAYIGLLSRLNKQNESSKGPILVMLSGPEPQRTILEKILIKQIQKIPSASLFVRGLPEDSVELPNSNNIVFKNFMDLQELSKAMSDSTLVICRAGYSSIMDLLKLNKKAILIPTPGQSEQLYLADRMKDLNLFSVQYQDDISIASEIENCLNIPPKYNSFNFDGFKKAIEDLGI
jgi:predicted glycosyltransferase